jgi:hypothetical protein
MAREATNRSQKASRASQSQARPSQNQRARRSRRQDSEEEAENENEAEAEEDDAIMDIEDNREGSDAVSVILYKRYFVLNFSQNITRKANDLVRLALFVEHKRTPLRKEDISKKGEFIFSASLSNGTEAWQFWYQIPALSIASLKSPRKFSVKRSEWN